MLANLLTAAFVAWIAYRYWDSYTEAIRLQSQLRRYAKRIEAAEDPANINHTAIQLETWLKRDHFLFWDENRALINQMNSTYGNVTSGLMKFEAARKSACENMKELIKRASFRSRLGPRHPQ